MNNININDVTKRCGKYCSDCIVPCSTCHMGKCEQCRYGYKSVVEKLLEKFTAEQLIPYKDKCPYAKLAVCGEEKEEKEIDNMIINESYMDSPETQCDRCNNSDICKYKDQVIEVNNKISEVVFNEELPIEINVNCKKFVTKKSIFR